MKLHFTPKKLKTNKDQKILHVSQAAEFCIQAIWESWPLDSL